MEKIVAIFLVVFMAIVFGICIYDYIRDIRRSRK